MCGIAGFTGRGSIDVLSRMLACIRHRGPDGQGEWTDQKVHFGHTRLAILDITGGYQPMVSEDGNYVVVFNGEIYNHRQLRAELEKEGARFHTSHSDTEVLLQAHQFWGRDLLQKLEGMWAFVIYDRKQNLIWGSRDRMGKKPLFYAHQNKAFVFASELSAVSVHPMIESELDDLSLLKYFAYGYFPSPFTPFKRILKLPPGSSFTYDLSEDELHVDRYWKYQAGKSNGQEGTLGGFNKKALLRLLEEAVDRRLEADVPLGVYLSGGLDSSLIAALAAKRRKIESFNIGFSDKSFDESAQALFSSRICGTEHHTWTLGSNDIENAAEDILDKLDEPLADASLLPTALLNKLSSQRIKVALTGDGGDELFAGYAPYKAIRWSQFYENTVPDVLHNVIRKGIAKMPVSHRYMSLDFKIKRALAGMSHSWPLRLAVWMAPLDTDSLIQAAAGCYSLEEIYSEAISTYLEISGDDRVAGLTQFFIHLYLPDDILVKADRASMAYGVEVRSPFLDVDLVEWTQNLPSHLKLHHGTSKYLLKEAARDILPDALVDRRKKGFGVPIGRWLLEGRFHVDDPGLLGNYADIYKEKLELHMTRQSDERLFLWAAYVFVRWRNSHGI